MKIYSDIIIQHYFLAILTMTELATFSDEADAAETNQVESSISSNKADGPENPEETTSMGRTDESPDNLDETMDGTHSFRPTILSLVCWPLM